MGIFNKLGGVLGTQKEMNVEEWMNSEEMENVDVMSEPADFYVKPLALQQESDLAIIQSELQKKNIILLNVSEMAKRPNTLKTMIDSLKQYVEKTNGDIARLDEEKILLTPSKVKIIKSRKPAQKK
ncbi:MAG: cell division protein SepF [Candidatus Micrarchaeales archaeon]|nr:cell division protein SepF [Candidatus Micrarchaeales archaeon]